MIPLRMFCFLFSLFNLLVSLLHSSIWKRAEKRKGERGKRDKGPRGQGRQICYYEK